MKRFFLLLLAVSIIVPSSKIAAQKKSYQNENLIGAGISLGYYSYGFAGSRSMGVPPLSAYYEKGVHDYFTVGPFVGFARWSYSSSYAGDWKYSWTFINVGARGSFHATGFLNDILGMEMDEEKIDWYLTLLLGMEFRNYKDDYGGHGGIHSNTSNFFIGPSAGVRYYVSDNFAIFAEGGRGALGALTFGVSLRR